MRIRDVIVSTVAISSSMRNAYIGFDTMTVSAVAVVTDERRHGRPVVGYGFTSNGRYAVSGVLQERLVPRLIASNPESLLNESRSNFDPMKTRKAMMRDEKPGGHGDRAHAVGALDMALWDLVAKLEDQPLHAVLASRFSGGRADKHVFVYAAGGYYRPSGSLGHLQDEMRRYLDSGFTVVKMKIGGADLRGDCQRIEAVLAVVGGGEHLAVDANARFNLDTALAYGDALRAYDLRWYEEPVDPLDYDQLAEVVKRYPGPVATGENLFSRQDARNLIRYGGLRPDRDILQFDPALSYGLTEYVEIQEMIAERGWCSRQCIPHGGHLMAVHAAAGLRLGGAEMYPGEFLPFGLLPDGMDVVDGHVRPSEEPGIGLEQVEPLYRILKELAA